MKPTTLKNIHAQELGRLGGLVKNPKRAAASRRNGRLGGRPRTDGEVPQPRIVASPIAATPKPRSRTARAPQWEF